MRRYELADEQWGLIADLFPAEQGNSRPWRSHRSMVNAMLWILNAGSPWRDLPDRYGPWQTAHNRFNRWRRDGTFDAILERLQMRLDEEGRIDTGILWMVDGSSVRAHASAAGGREKGGPDEPRNHALGRSRGGFGTKIHLVADSEGTPLAVRVTPGQTHEVAGFESVVDAVRIPQAWGRPRTRPLRLAGDKGYDAPWVRDGLRRRHITPIIPEKHNPHGRKPGLPLALNTETYRRRNVLERSISWLKHARRIATRFEKLALNFLAMLKLAMIQRYLRFYLRDTT